MNRAFISTLITLLITASAYSQIAPRPQGMPDRSGRDGRRGQEMDRQGPPPQRDWMKAVDTNDDGKVDVPEFGIAIEATFRKLDRNSNNLIDANEMPRPPRGPEGPGMRPGEAPLGDLRAPNAADRNRPGMRPEWQEPSGDSPASMMLPPFFFADRMDRETSTSRADFERIARGVFNEMDKDKDGVISRNESRPPKHPDGPDGPPEGRTPPPPNGQFIAAELRFGDRLVKGQPFSAETVVEDTRRLFDGTTVTRSSHGAFYRDSTGRTRREQPLEMIGGVAISGADGKPQTLVFINDFAAGEQYFLDTNNKVVRKHKIGSGPGPERPKREGERTESLGKKTIEGIEVEGTRITFEIPAGKIGNDKPMQVVTENWFSPDLQMMVLSRHTDPIAGEHIFKLVNIKRGEQSGDLFAIPAGFKVETPKAPRPEER